MKEPGAESDSISKMLEDSLRLIWDKFLCWEGFLTWTIMESQAEEEKKKEKKKTEIVEVWLALIPVMAGSIYHFEHCLSPLCYCYFS